MSTIEADGEDLRSQISNLQSEEPEMARPFWRLADPLVTDG
jgi:hypothetical protein